MLFAVVAVCVVGLGCSIIDTPCKTFGEVQCIGAKTSVICLGAEYHWSEVECPGGCTSGSTDVCDFTGVADDSPCPASMADKGQCETRDGTAVAVYCDGTRKRWKVQPCVNGCKVYTGPSAPSEGFVGCY